MEEYVTTIEDKEIIFSDSYIIIDDYQYDYDKIKNIKYTQLLNNITNNLDWVFTFDYKYKDEYYTKYIPCNEDEKNTMIHFFQKTLYSIEPEIEIQLVSDEFYEQHKYYFKEFEDEFDKYGCIYNSLLDMKIKE